MVWLHFFFLSIPNLKIWMPKYSTMLNLLSTDMMLHVANFTMNFTFRLVSLPQDISLCTWNILISKKSKIQNTSGSKHFRQEICHLYYMIKKPRWKSESALVQVFDFLLITAIDWILELLPLGVRILSSLLLSLLQCVFLNPSPRVDKL
jgi:hypothetical protein